jgi:hypothetical protein
MFNLSFILKKLWNFKFCHQKVWLAQVNKDDYTTLICALPWCILDNDWVMKGHGKFCKGLAFEINITPIEKDNAHFYNFTNRMAPTLKLIFKT